MSHQTEYKAAEMDDLNALTKAAKELGFTLEEADLYSGYGGRMHECTHRICMDGCPYDVGIHAKDGKVQSMATDWYAGYVKRCIGEGYSKLKQMYGVVRAEAEARRHGYTVRRETKGEQILLTIGGIR